MRNRLLDIFNLRTNSLKRRQDNGGEIAAPPDDWKMTADGRLVCSSDDDHDSLAKTESCSLDPEACELEYLHFNGDKLLWSNDLDSLKNFVVNVLKLQGKWLMPGGNTKQFKSSNSNVIINWYSKKQQILNFQRCDGPGLRDKLVELVLTKPGTSTDMQASGPLESVSEVTSNDKPQVLAAGEGSGLDNCDCKGLSREMFAEMEGVKPELVILQNQVEANTRSLSSNWQSEETLINEELQSLELTRLRNENRAL